MPLPTTCAEFRTVGDLAAILAQLPPDMELGVAEHVRVDPKLHLDVDPDRTAAAVIPVLIPQPADPVTGQPGAAATLGVQLAAVVVAADAPVPAVTVPLCPHERGVIAVVMGHLAGIVDAHQQLVHYAGEALGAGDPTLTDAITDPDLRSAVLVEANRLIQAATRMEVLRERIAAHEHATGR